MKTSKLIKHVADGDYYAGKHHDLFVTHLRYPDKVRLSVEEKLIFDRIERTKELWLHHKQDALVIPLIKEEFKISTSHCYNYLSDAKALWALFVAFNPMAELLMQKERIDKAFQLAQENPKEYGKLYPAALIANEKWIELMQKEVERQRPEEPRTINFYYHMDFRELGVSDEQMEEMKAKMKALKQRIHAKSNAEDITDAEFTTD